MRQAGKTDIELVEELIGRMKDELPDETWRLEENLKSIRLIEALEAVVHDAKFPDVACNRVDNDWP